MTESPSFHESGPGIKLGKNKMYFVSAIQEKSRS